MSLERQTVVRVSDYVRQLCGIELGDDKSYLIEARLLPLAEERGCSDLSELIERAAAGETELRTEIVNAITTNETSFFRDPAAFQALRFKALPELIDAKSGSMFPNRLRLWSCACSFGQEPYSLLFALEEVLGDLTEWDIQVLATDISDAAVSRASRGLFSHADVQRGLTVAQQGKYFSPEGDALRVKDQYRSLVKFRTMNLLDDFGALGQFDFIFCRNVAIYFANLARTSLFKRLKSRLHSYGYLFAGSMELLADVGPEFQPQSHCGSTFYRPNLVAGGAAL